MTAMREQGLPHHRHRSSFCPQSTSRGWKNLWDCSSHDPPWLQAHPTCPQLALNPGCSSCSGSSTQISSWTGRSKMRDAWEGCHPRMWHLAAAGTPVSMGRAPGRCWEVVPGFLAVGDEARSRFGNQELSCLPPAPFTAQTATCFMAAEGHCTGSINPVSQCFLPGKLAPVQSRQEGLAALCRDSQQLSQLDGTLDFGIPPAFCGQPQKVALGASVLPGKVPDCHCCSQNKGDPARDCAGSAGGSGNSLGVIKIQTWYRQKHRAAHSCCGPSSSDTCRIWGDTLASRSCQAPSPLWVCLRNSAISLAGACSL